MPFFSNAVFEARLANMRRLMEARSLDGLIFTQMDFDFYASNFSVDVEPWERPTAVLVPCHGKPPRRKPCSRRPTTSNGRSCRPETLP